MELFDWKLMRMIRDCGLGNMFIDNVMWYFIDGVMEYDKDGEWSVCGIVN